MKSAQSCAVMMALALGLSARPAAAQLSDSASPAFVGPRRPAAAKEGETRKKRPATGRKKRAAGVHKAAAKPPVVHAKAAVVPDVALPSPHAPPALMSEKSADSGTEGKRDERKKKLKELEADRAIEPPMHGQLGGGFAKPTGSVRRSELPGRGWHGANPQGNGGGNGNGNGNGTGTAGGGKPGHSGAKGVPGSILKWENHDPQLAERVQQMLESGLSWKQIERRLRQEQAGASGPKKGGHDAGSDAAAGGKAVRDHGVSSAHRDAIPADILKLQTGSPDLAEEVQSMRESGLSWGQVKRELRTEAGASSGRAAPKTRAAKRKGGKDLAVETPGHGFHIHGPKPVGGLESGPALRALPPPKPAPLPKEPKIQVKKGK